MALLANRRGLAGTLGVVTAVGLLGVSACGEDDCRETRTCGAVPSDGGSSANEGGHGPTLGGTGADSSTAASAAGGAAPIECETSDDCDDGVAANGFEICGSDGLCEFGDPPPSVVAITPEAGASEIEPETEIVITFSEPIAGATATADTVQLLDRGVPVAATLQTQGATVTLTPDEPLALWAEYEVAVLKGLTDLESVGLLEEFSSTFRVRDGAWHTSNAVQGTLYQLADTLPIATSGDVLVAWTAVNQTGYYCPTSANWFNRGEPLSSEPAVLTGLDIQDCRSVTAGANASGVGAVVWQENVEYARQYRAGQWSPEKEQVSDYGASQLYTVAVAPDNSVSFFQHVGSDTMVRRSDSQGKWAALAYKIGSARGLSRVNVALDAEGDGVAAWVAQDDASRQLIYISRYSKASGLWSAARTLPGSIAEDSTADHERGVPAVAVDNEGRALVLWVRETGSSVVNLMASRMNDAGQWDAPAAISGTTMPRSLINAPGLVFDGETFVAVWLASVGKAISVYSARFDMSLEQFTPPETLAQELAALHHMPRLVTDGRGNLLTVWARQHASGASLAYLRYDALAGAWGEVAPIPEGVVHDSNFAAGAPMPLSMNAQGLGALMWGDENDENGLTAIRLASFH